MGHDQTAASGATLKAFLAAAAARKALRVAPEAAV